MKRKSRSVGPGRARPSRAGSGGYLSPLAAAQGRCRRLPDQTQDKLLGAVQNPGRFHLQNRTTVRVGSEGSVSGQNLAHLAHRGRRLSVQEEPQRRQVPQGGAVEEPRATQRPLVEGGALLLQQTENMEEKCSDTEKSKYTLTIGLHVETFQSLIFYDDSGGRKGDKEPGSPAEPNRSRKRVGLPADCPGHQPAAII